MKKLSLKYEDDLKKLRTLAEKNPCISTFI